MVHLGAVVLIPSCSHCLRENTGQMEVKRGSPYVKAIGDDVEQMHDDNLMIVNCSEL